MGQRVVRVVARVVGKPDKLEELRATLLSLIEPTRAEPGCLRYELLQNLTDPTDFTFVEDWRDDASFQAHLETEHFRAAAARLTQLVETVPDIRRYHTVA